MKSLFVALLTAAVLAAPVTEALAQAGDVTTPAPGGTTSEKSVTSERSTTSSGTVRSEDRKDDGAALPRSAVVERTTIFGLSPTAAVLIAAALLLVVVLAIVAMTRGNETYVDR